MMTKIDGHTHTELCPHGSGQSTKAMIERAIELGIEEYWLTEHAPLPTGFVKRFAGPADDWQCESLMPNQVDEYLKLAHDLQSEFKDQIKIKIGFEIEYLAGFEAETKTFLDQYGPVTQGNIISVHYLKDDQDRFWGIDYSTDELAQGFPALIKQPQKLYAHYLKAVLASAQADFGKYQPQKLGHISLIKKYQDYFGFPDKFDENCCEIIQKIMEIAQAKRLSLDFNSAGMYKKYGNDFYPGIQIAELAVTNGIRLEFGSDAHAIDEVGRGMHAMQNFVKILDLLKQ